MYSEKAEHFLPIKYDVSILINSKAINSKDIQSETRFFGCSWIKFAPKKTC